MTVSNRRALLLGIAASVVALTSSQVSGQQFPDRPVTFVVPFATGTATDLLARTLANVVMSETGQPVIIDNKPGASGIIASMAVARARPDGHTILIGTNTTHAANPHLFKSLPYDPIKDFVPITTTGRGAQILVVRPDSKASSVKELITLAQTRTLSFGSGSASSRVAGELFQQMANIRITHVPYKSNTLALTDLVGGQIDMVFTDSATGIPMVQNGTLKALGLTSRTSSPKLPGVRPISDTDLPGYEMTYWSGAWAPAGTPAPVVGRLNELLTRAVHADSSLAYYEGSATDRFTMSSSDFVKFQQAELARWGSIVRSANIQPE